MTKGIVLNNCSDILIDSNTFENLDIAVEAKGSRKIRLTRNKIRYVDPRINQLLREIDKSTLPISTKRDLGEHIIHTVFLGQKRKLSERERQGLLLKIKNILGRGSWELGKAIIADLVAGRILMKIANLG